MLTDTDIINYFWGNKKILQKEKLNNIDKDIYEYLINRYTDSLSILETINRIKLNILTHPICPICHNNLVKYKGRYLSSNIFQSTCDDINCIKKYKGYKSQLTKLERYGDSHYNNSNKMLQTKLEKYGDSNYHNIEKMKQTCLERYGLTNGGGTEQSIKKSKQTKLERYNDPTFANPEKAKETKLKKYGDENYINVKKIKQTKLERYGDSNYHNIEKMKQTCLERYGLTNGGGTIQALNKAKNTCLSKYNTEYYFQSNNFKEKFKNNEKQIIEKRNNTKRKNNTFNKSKPEDKSYILLKEKYPDVIRQYKSELYPFNCDFYIPSLDLYIECNYFWMHGYKPYQGTKEDLLKLNNWKNHNTNCYKSAIETWTIRDIKKRNTAKENNLNWIEFFDIKELKKWIDTYE